MKFVKYGVAYTTSVMKTDCIASQWHIARLPPSSIKNYSTMQADPGTLCNEIEVMAKMALLLQLPRG